MHHEIVRHKNMKHTHTHENTITDVVIAIIRDLFAVVFWCSFLPAPQSNL